MSVITGLIASRTQFLRYIGPKQPSVLIKSLRYSSGEMKPDKKPPVSVQRKSLYKTKEAKKIRFYLLTRFVDYLKNYDKVLDKNFPAAMKVYRVFKDGCRDFLLDTKEYFRIIIFLSKPQNRLSSLLRKELELYQQMPKDILRVSPVLIIFSLPLGPYVILPVAYKFPRTFLSSHFWSLEQRAKYKILNLRDRLIHNRPVFRHLQSQLKFLKNHCSYEHWSGILGALGSGIQPTVPGILDCKDLFVNGPYHLMYLSNNHVNHLLKMHDLHIGWFRRTRLAERASLLIHMDKAIMKEGGVHNLPVEALKNSCYIRGLNPANLTNEEMITWLCSWIQLSSKIDKDSYSLLLHAPVLLAYNAPSNWQIIYANKK